MAAALKALEIVSFSSHLFRFCGSRSALFTDSSILKDNFLGSQGCLLDQCECEYDSIVSLSSCRYNIEEYVLV